MCGGGGKSHYCGKQNGVFHLFKSSLNQNRRSYFKATLIQKQAYHSYWNNDPLHTPPTTRQQPT
ncbi:hypothetical protein [Moraxella lacunata]|uniref:hypothetical protein n=1 Tax=Moraxella lacunata TaxID=477 RepID=UPI003EDFA879